MTTLAVSSTYSYDSADASEKQQQTLDIGRLAGQCLAPSVTASIGPSRPWMVRSMSNNTVPLRGGDCIFNRRGDRATLAVAWERQGKKFGLTVAHLVNSAQPSRGEGEPIFAFNCSMPLGWMQDGTPVYKRILVGKVVSIDHDTDSLVFEIDDSIKIVPQGVTVYSIPRQLSVADGGQDVHYIEFPDHNISTVHVDVPKRSRLMGFGAAGRGVVGRCINVYSRQYDTRAKMKLVLDNLLGRHAKAYDIEGVTNRATFSRSANELKDKSDCGFLYLDEKGKPCCMQITTYLTGYGVFTSFAVGFREIMKSHAYFFDFQRCSSASSSLPAAPFARAEGTRRRYLIESTDYAVVVDGTTKPWAGVEDEYVQTVPSAVETKGMELGEQSFYNGHRPMRSDCLFENKLQKTSDVISYKWEGTHETEEYLDRITHPSYMTLVMPDVCDDDCSDNDDFHTDGTSDKDCGIPTNSTV